MTDSKKVLVSVIVPTYNRGKIINRAIDSIKAQTLKDWECIIVDDHSDDETKSIVAGLINDDKRFLYLINERKKGAPGARNTGVLKAKGKYIVLFDSDNVMHPTFLEKVYNSIVNNNVDGGACFSRIIDEVSGKTIGTFKWVGNGNVYKDVLREKTYFDNSSTIISREKLIDIGLLDENCPSYQEWDTHIRLSRHCTYITIKEELIDYYRGGSDTISKSKIRAIKGRLFIYRKFRDEFKKNVPFIYLKNSFGIFCEINSLDEVYFNEKQLFLKEFLQEQSETEIIIIRLLYWLRSIKKKIMK